MTVNELKLPVEYFLNLHWIMCRPRARRVFLNMVDKLDQMDESQQKETMRAVTDWFAGGSDT